MNKEKYNNSRWFLLCLTVFLLTALVFIVGCATEPVERNYYIIDYQPVPEDPSLVLRDPLPFRVEVSNSRISRVYDRSQIVLRFSHHKIEYASQDLWAVRLSASIPDALTNHLIRYNTFETTQRDFLLERPHYEVITMVNQVEMLQSDYYFGARVDMDISLRRSEDLEYVARHSFKRETELYTDNVEAFVQETSRIIKEETDIFIEKVLLKFDVYEKEDIPQEEAEDVVGVDEDTEIIEEIRPERPQDQFGLTEKQIDTWLMPPPREQLIRESRRDVVGLGRVFLPAMSSPELEPLYTLYSEEQNANFFERMGNSIYLKPGEYSLNYGSGAEDQKMSRELTVIRDHTHVIEPDWGGLRIRVIDEFRNTLDTRYELFKVETAESFGYGQGALEELGEQLQTWILEPAAYKIVLNNRPFNTLEDFFTVDVVEGELRIITLVIDSETNNLKGAGFLESLEHTREIRDWRFSSAIHGSFNLNRDNRVDRDNPSMSYTVSTQFDNRLNYDNYPYYFTSHNLTDLGISRETGQDFRISTDSFKLRNTFVYYLSRIIGVYSRADVETHFFDEYIYPSDPRNYQLEESDGSLIERRKNRDRLRVKPSFFPLIFREGGGLNVRPVNRPRASLNIRFGLGMRQDIYRNVLRFDRTIIRETESYDVYREIDSSYREGTELSLIGNFHFPYNISYNTNADVLFPFSSDESSSYNWENTFSIRLIRQAAIDYRINLAYNKDIRDYVEVVQNVYLRLTYFLY